MIRQWCPLPIEESIPFFEIVTSSDLVRRGVTNNFRPSPRTSRSIQVDCTPGKLNLVNFSSFFMEHFALMERMFGHYLFSWAQWADIYEYARR